MAGAPVLVVVGGLPATGKSTVASALARQAGFTFVRVDRIEQAIIDSAGLRQPLGPVGYTVAYGVAAEQLRHGVSVVAECVNPLGVTRDAWRDVAAGHGARLVEVELVCTDQAAHRERAQTREVDIRGLRLPDWEQITSREYEPWNRGHLVIDTATRTPAEAVATILAAIPEGPVMFQPIRTDPPPDLVRRITFVPFLADGRCVLIDEPGGPALPSGEVLDGEHYLLDTVLRVPLQTAGFRYQRFHPFGLDRDHLYAWIEGGPYTGSRPHRTVVLLVLLRRGGGPAAGRARRVGARRRRACRGPVVPDAGRARVLRGQPAHPGAAPTCAGPRPGRAQGSAADAREWEQARRHLTEVISGDGTFLDVGCANGLLMESVAAWCAERGLAVEPYGVDISPALAELARRGCPSGTTASGSATP